MLPEQATRPDFPADIRLSGHGVVLREWTDADIPAMAELFDDPAVAFWTPLASPFDHAAARDYLARARGARAAGDRVHLAITTEGQQAKGEVLLSRGGWERGAASIGYAVGPAHRGQGLAVRAVRVMVDFAHTVAGLSRVLLEIEDGNEASKGVAHAAGFHRTHIPPTVVEEKGRTLQLFTWVHG